jgi:hypothetical protein
MNGKLLLLLTVAMLVAFPASSRAETVNTTADLQSHQKTAAYLFSGPMLDVMRRLGLQQDKKFGLQQDCISQRSVQPVSSLILSPIDFPDDAPHPTQGAWFLRYQFERCGEAKLYNVLFVANRDGTVPTARTYYPGATIASPDLVNDAMPSVVSGMLARSGLKNCNKIDVFDMRVTDPTHNIVEGSKIFKDVWSETWTFRMCGKMNDVAVTFIPDANGGTTFTSGPITP